MVFNKQGFSLDLKTNENEIFIILKATGKLTHEDYLTLIPKIQARHYFCESLFWASQPKQAAKITWQLMPSAPRFVLRPCHCVTSLQARC